MKIVRGVVGGFSRLHENFDTSIDMAIRMQVENGIGILCDGDQRGDMISYFAADMPGLGLEDGRPLVRGKVSPPEDPTRVKRVQDILMLKGRYPELEFKASLAGPTTLAMSCGSRKIVGGYRNYADFLLASDIADALSEIVRPLAKERVRVQIDEPFFSQGFRDLKERVALVDIVLEGCDASLCSVHVCGYLGRQPLLQELANLQNASVLSHAFSIARDREMENMELLTRSLFDDSGKKLAAGVLSVSPRTLDEVETPSVVAARLSEIARRIGIENVTYVTPDCYLRAVSPEITARILKNLDAGVSLFEDALE